MAESDDIDIPPVKKSKTTETDDNSCIIHCTDDDSPLAILRDHDSWGTLLRAARARNHTRLLQIANKTPEGEIPEMPIKYHRKCRSLFTMKREVEKLEAKNETGAQGKSEMTIPVRRSSREKTTAGNATVYEKVCIFKDIICKGTKYKTKSNTREELVQCKVLKSDATLRRVAEHKQDTKILALTSRDIVAAEAHYHRSCYKWYIKDDQSSPPATSMVEGIPNDDIYTTTEARAFSRLCAYLRNELFENPEVVLLSNLQGRLTQWMQDEGISDIKESTKKNLKRKLLAEFPDALSSMKTSNDRICLVPITLSRDQLALQNIQLQEEIKQLKRISTRSQDHAKEVTRVAENIRQEIKELDLKSEWPPRPASLTSDNVCIPPTLYHFLKTVLTEVKSDTDISQRVATNISSVAQDIIFSIHHGAQQPPKHILLAHAVKALTGNVELIQILNRLGHAISYTQLQEIDTALCLHKLAQCAEDELPLPSSLWQYVPTTLGWDNIDRLEETLSGAGTSHRVNGIAVQPVMQGPRLQSDCQPAFLEKTKQRSINSTEKQLPYYNAGERCGPPQRQYIDGNYDEAEKQSRLKNLLWILARLYNADQQNISSWTGFNIRVHRQEDIVENTIEYLPTINAPATDMSTVHEILTRSESICCSLNLPSIVAVFDMALYAKAAEIKWKHMDKFGNIVLRMGAFHTICNLLGIIGKRFGDAGLREMGIEAVELGSMSGVLEGKKYNRAVRMHKLIYEALSRIVWESFTQKIPGDEILEELSAFIEELCNDVSFSTFNEVLSKPIYADVAYQYQEHLDFLRKDNGELSAFWISYLDIVEVMFNLLRASREGNWELHLASIKSMIPWCFAYDHRNYAKYLSVYYQDMTLLPVEHPEVDEYMKTGGFCVQMSTSSSFGRIPVDQTVEETVNKDTQSSAGTRGFSLKPMAVQKFYITAEYRSRFLHNIREMVSQKKSQHDHPDLHKPRIQADERIIQSIVDLVSNNWINPFLLKEQSLVSISSGIAAPETIKKDLLNAHGTGTEAYDAFKTRLTEPGGLKFTDRLASCNLKTFKHTAKSTTFKVKNAEKIIRADRNLFAQMVLMAQNRKLQMEDVLQHPLGPLPWSLATSDGLMRKTNKATLGNHVVKNINVIENIPSPRASVIDGMALVQKMFCDNKTFAEIAAAVFEQVLRIGIQSERIDVVFDVYIDDSIKNAERTLRGEGTGVTYTKIVPSHKMKQWRSFLKNASNKANLIRYLVSVWKTEHVRQGLGNKVLYVTCEEMCYRLTTHSVDVVDELNSTHEEADTRMFLHVNHISQQHYVAVILHAEDTDVRLLAIANTPNFTIPLFQRSSTQNRLRYIDISKVHSVLGPNVASALPGLHSFTGCDSVSAFAGKGKLPALKLVKAQEKFQDLFQKFGDTFELDDEAFVALEEFTCLLYGSKNGTKTVNRFRYEMFSSKKGKIDSYQLPPCQDTLRKHAMRACYQAAIWKRCLERHIDVPCATTYGWKSEDGQLVLDWMEGPPAPEAVVELMACICKRKCELPTCTCLQNNIKCTDLCKLKTCTNQKQEDDTESESSDSDGDASEEDEDE